MAYEEGSSYRTSVGIGVLSTQDTHVVRIIIVIHSAVER